MNPFIEKYHQTKGTHCWFCDRPYEKKRIRTREHIVPKSVIIYSYPKNYIGSCQFCNGMKGSKNAKQFALSLDKLIKSASPATHNQYKLYKIMRERAWKLYNKTSNLHKNFKTLRMESK